MDHTAGMPVDSRVLEAMRPYLDKVYGNPSSLHSFAQDARKALEESRIKIAELINAEKKEEVFFTSGATESNNWAIRGAAARSKDSSKHIITTSIEHMSVINVCKYLTRQGFRVSFLPVDRQGLVDLEALKNELNTETILLSVTYASGEIGTVEPLKEISEIVHSHDAYLHVDATAAMGQLDIDVQSQNIDLLTMSSNDMYGPKGMGGLYIKGGTRIEPLIFGGGQERGLRSGTENLPGIVGFGKAAELAKKEMDMENDRLSKLRDRFISSVLKSIPYSFLNGHPSKRLPNNVALRFSFIEGESMLLNLDMAGIAASSGSACTAKTLEPSHVLRALGLKHEEAHGSLLFTLGRNNTQEDVEYVTGLLPDIVKRLRAMSPLTPKELREGV
ncbi:MAG: aminotransferase class V-fold PLP-dependent enzyme [Candidatus Bathyarchaeota archaeon]|nr:aminotransferase class V-fold PLP-dependent enzyme [Candidatus Bathyarchaeota archaeon]